MAGKSKQTQKSEQTTSGWKPVMDQIKSDVLPNIAAWGQQYGGGEGLWTGSQLGAQDTNVGAGQDMILGAADQYASDYQNVRGTLQGFLDYDPNSYQNQASREALRNNATAQFNEVIRPGVEDMGTASGQFGGNQQSLALGAASAPLSRAIADNEYNLMNADRDRAFNALINSGQIMLGGFVPGQAYEGVGNARTARGQLEQLDQINQYESPRNNALLAASQHQGLLSPLAGLEQTSKGTVTTTSKPSALQTAIGVGALAAGAYTGGAAGGLGSLSGLFGGDKLSPITPGFDINGNPLIRK